MPLEPVRFIVGAIFAFLFGTVIGSFLNVCIYRLPRGESLSTPPSHCPSCNTRLRVVDLVPLFSFLALRCRCRYCKKPISWRYFSIELLTGLLFAGCWWSLAARFPDDIWTGAGLVLVIALSIWVASMLVTFMIDLDTTYVIEPVTWVAMFCGLAFEVTAKLVDPELMDHARTLGGPSIQYHGIPYLPAAIPGMVLGFLFFIGIDLFGRLIFRKPGMGLGDSFIGAAIGAMLGPGCAMIAFGLSIVLGAVVGVALMIIGKLSRSSAPGAEEEQALQRAVAAQPASGKRKKGRKSAPPPKVEELEELPQGYYMPFGPFLTASAVAVALAPGWFVLHLSHFWAWWMSSMG